MRTWLLTVGSCGTRGKPLSRGSIQGRAAFDRVGTPRDINTLFIYTWFGRYIFQKLAHAISFICAEPFINAECLHSSLRPYSFDNLAHDANECLSKSAKPTDL